jgi:hypothetical protein
MADNKMQIFEYKNAHENYIKYLEIALSIIKETTDDPSFQEALKSKVSQIMRKVSPTCLNLLTLLTGRAM